MLIGQTQENKDLYLSESGLYQNFLITGTIGTGKTSSALYPFTKQLMSFNSQNNSENKIAMLILDVKGSYCNQVFEFARKFNIVDDIITIGINTNFKYNPLHKPNLKPQILANRLITILNLFSENNSESFWFDKVEQILTEAIKFCRLYNNNYVTFQEIHKLILSPNYYKEKLAILKSEFISQRLSESQIFDLNSSLNFFENEFFSLDSRTISILKSEITRITNTFITDKDVLNSFSPKKNELNFLGFSEVLVLGKIVVLDMNIAKYRNLSKILAAYLKLDFQSEILENLSKNIKSKSAFICDEYDKYISKTDAEFFSLSREAKCINIVSTQSYSSIKSALNSDSITKVTIQNLVNKLWFRTDDIFTIEEAQKQLGKTEKEKTSRSISENAKETKYNFIAKSFISKDTNLSETYNTYTQNDYIFESNFFSQNLETFSCLSFLSDGLKIIPPQKINMIPFFK